jgi:hypothetical protein
VLDALVAIRLGIHRFFFFHENTSLQPAETLKKLGFRYQFKKRMQQQASSKPLQNQSFPIL